VELFFSDNERHDTLLLYDWALSCVQRKPQDALLAFARAPVGPAAPPEVLPRHLDEARAALGRFWSDTGRVPDGEFLRWYAHERERVEDNALQIAMRQRTALRNAWKLARGRVHDAADAACQWVPERLGKLVLDTGTVGAPRFAIGLQRGRVPRFALSGAEWTIALSCLALACAAPGPVNILAPADVGMDEALLRAWCAVLTSTQAQVLLATTHDLSSSVSVAISVFSVLHVR
jgi:hypothetical protein